MPTGTRSEDCRRWKEVKEMFRSAALLDDSTNADCTTLSTCFEAFYSGEPHLHEVGNSAFSNRQTIVDARILSLKENCFLSLLKSYTLEQFKTFLLSEKPFPFPEHLIPELMAWALYSAVSPRFVAVILKCWPGKTFDLNSVLCSPYEGKASLKSPTISYHISRGKIVTVSNKRIYSTKLLLSAMDSLFLEENVGGKILCSIDWFDLTGMPVTLSCLHQIKENRGKQNNRRLIFDLAVTGGQSSDEEVLQCSPVTNNGTLKISLSGLYYHSPPSRYALRKLLSALDPHFLKGISLKLCGLEEVSILHLLKRFESLVSLDMSQNRINVQDQKVTTSLNDVLKQLNNLQSLALGGLRLTDSVAMIFDGVLARFKYVDLSSCHLTEKDFNLLSRSRCFETVEKFDVSHNRSFKNAFLSVFETFRNLSILCICIHDVKPPTLNSFFRSLRLWSDTHTKHLRMLQIHSSDSFTLEKETVKRDVLPQVYGMPNLRWLQLPCKSVTEEDKRSKPSWIVEEEQKFDGERRKAGLSPLLIKWILT